MPSIRCETYFADELNTWWNYYDKIPEEGLGAYHRPDYFLFQEKIGLGKAFLQVFSHDEQFIYYPGLLRPLPSNEKGYDIDSGWYYGGPVSNLPDRVPLGTAWTEAIDSARKALDATCEFIRFDPNLENHSLLENLIPAEHNRETVAVELHPEWQTVWKNFSSQNRRNAKKASKQNLVVTNTNDPSCWDSFMDIYMEEMIRKNAPTHLRFNVEFFNALQQLPFMDLFVVTLHGVIIGGFIAAAGKHIAHHYLSATKYEFWDARPNNLLFTEVIKYYHQSGRKIFDFQGGRDGVFRFKCNFSNNRKSFYVGKKIFDHEKYNDLSKDRRTDFFPAYREPARAADS